MPVDLTIRGMPENLYERLKERARRNRRSLREEVLAILESALATHPLDLRELQRRVEDLGLKTADEATGWLRGEREAR